MKKEYIEVNLESTSEPCRYLKYDMEGGHCLLHKGEGVGDYCKLKWGNDCDSYVSKNEKRKCDCCGKIVDHINVLCSGIVAASFAYCNECASKEIEPYNVLVSYFAGEISENKWNDLTAYWQGIIKNSCEVSGHTLEQFFQDCNKYMENCKHWSDRLC